MGWTGGYLRFGEDSSRKAPSTRRPLLRRLKRRDHADDAVTASQPILVLFGLDAEHVHLPERNQRRRRRSRRTVELQRCFVAGSHVYDRVRRVKDFIRVEQDQRRLLRRRSPEWYVG